MSEELQLSLARHVSQASIWNIAKLCVLAAGGALNGQTPDAFAPLNHWILDADSMVGYYRILQNMLVSHGFNVAVDTNPPWGLDDISTKDFLDMIRAVDTRMLQR